jgi:hypothetical protein
MGNEELDEYERYLLEQLAELRHCYLKACEPYLKKLAYIHAMRVPAPVILDTSKYDSDLLKQIKKMWSDNDGK